MASKTIHDDILPPAPKASHLIAVSGLIGVGKTTLANQLATLLSGRMIHEEYFNNPFLARQFQGDREAALPSELYFLLSRARQLDRTNLQGSPIAVCDYIFQKNRIFAGLCLDSEQFAIYDRVERSILPYLTRPSIVIYLNDHIENCLQRIAGRGRDYERTISAEWLERLHRKYETMFEYWSDCPLIRIECNEFDFRQKADVLNVLERIKEVAPSLFNDSGL